MIKRIYLFLLILCIPLYSCGMSRSDENKKTMKASEIVKLISKGENIQISEMIIEGDIDFTEIQNNYVISLNSVQNTVKSNIFFIDCVFLGNVTSSGSYLKFDKKIWFEKNVSFIACDFRKDFNLSNATIEGVISIAKSVFRGDARMEAMTVLGTKNSFWEIEADSSFSIAQSDIRGDANFMNSKFSKNASFQYLRVINLLMNNIEFNGLADFTNISVAGSFTSNYSKYIEAALFSFSRISGSFDIINSKFSKKVDFGGITVFGEANISNSEFKEDYVSENAYFLRQLKTDGIKNAVDFSSENALGSDNNKSLVE